MSPFLVCKSSSRNHTLSPTPAFKPCWMHTFATSVSQPQGEPSASPLPSSGRGQRRHNRNRAPPNRRPINVLIHRRTCRRTTQRTGWEAKCYRIVKANTTAVGGSSALQSGTITAARSLEAGCTVRRRLPPLAVKLSPTEGPSAITHFNDPRDWNTPPAAFTSFGLTDSNFRLLERRSAVDPGQ
jgi:hypothetical protein